MDKKNLIFGLFFIGLAGVLIYTSSQQIVQQQPPNPVIAAPQESTSSQAAVASTAIQPTQVTPSTVATTATPENAVVPAVDVIGEEIEIAPLSNAFIEVRFSTRGGAIQEVVMPKHKATKDSTQPYTFNEGSTVPVLAWMVTWDQGISWQPWLGTFREVARDNTPEGGHRVVLEGTLPSGLVLRRTYEIAQTPENGKPAWEPYEIIHRTELINNGEAPTHPGRFAFSLGTAEPVSSDSYGEFLNFGYYNGADAEFTKVADFQGGGFWSIIGQGRPALPSISKQTNVVWASVKNQYFTSVLTPTEPAQGFYTKPVEFPTNEQFPKGGEGITGNVEFNPYAIEPGQALVQESRLYVGPKEYSRLTRLGEHQDLIMQFGFFGGISKLLLTLMNWFYSIIPNYGVAIILVTVLIKLLLWPLTAKAAKSAKKMSKIQAPLKELREKYKDNQQKLQQETLKLFRANKVNPLAGCLPILVQIPIFFALFWMLRSSTELRYAGFIFWIKDLSQPDTVATIGGFPINILPLLMGITMFYQMKMTPMSMDNAQAKIFKFMPFIFLIFCYNFSSGLVLYWTVQNLLTILQQYLTNHRKDPAEDAVVIPGAPSKKSKKKK
jgi:YidC/Oxa1 family membrane protein insertase